VSAETEVRRLRNELTKLRDQIARESAKISVARAKAAKARAAAAKATSPTTARSRQAEADREEKAASEAERRRAQLEAKAAKVEADLYKAQNRLEAERAAAQKRALDRIEFDARQRRLQFEPVGLTLAPAPRLRTAGAVEGVSKDVFISHASEDKDEIARPLAEALMSRGVSVFFDELDIRVGMSIRRAIERGIANCRFGVLILSPNFFVKKWTMAELDGLFGRQMATATGEGFLLPIWHKLSRDEVQAQVPMLADIQALNTSLYTIDECAERVAEVVRASRAIVHGD